MVLTRIVNLASVIEYWKKHRKNPLLIYVLKGEHIFPMVLL